MPWSKTAHLATIILLLCLCGCGAEEEIRPALHPVQGSLLVNGKPAEGAMLVLHPADGKEFDARGTRPRATVSADGSFQVATYQTGDGAPIGEYQIAVLWFDDPDSSNPWDKLGNQYSNPQSSKIQVSVQEGENHWEPIQIENARILNRPPRRQSSKDFDQVD